MMNQLNWPSLEQRRISADLVLLSKVVIEQPCCSSSDDQHTKQLIIVDFVFTSIHFFSYSGCRLKQISGLGYQ